MTNRTRIGLLSVALTALLLPVAAQDNSQTMSPAGTAPTQGSPTTTPEKRTINQRKENQQDRIANGVGSGQLTAGEATNLEKKESELNQEERDMKALDNGHLNNTDRSILQKQQNQLSNQIYKDKHNGAVQNTDPKSKIGKRAENQQDRISQGINSGQLTAGEAGNLEKQESAVNKEMAAERQLNGGKLTPQEKAQVNQQQNHISKEIYKDKHNGKR
jgi:hypothetical protein